MARFEALKWFVNWRNNDLIFEQMFNREQISILARMLYYFVVLESSHMLCFFIFIIYQQSDSRLLAYFFIIL